MGIHVGLAGDGLDDDPIGSDDEGDAAVEQWPGALDTEGGGDGSIGVREQGKVETVLCGERFLALDGVGADAETKCSDLAELPFVGMGASLVHRCVVEHAGHARVVVAMRHDEEQIDVVDIGDVIAALVRVTDVGLPTVLIGPVETTGMACITQRLVKAVADVEGVGEVGRSADLVRPGIAEIDRMTRVAPIQSAATSRSPSGSSVRFLLNQHRSASKPWSVWHALSARTLSWAWGTILATTARSPRWCVMAIPWCAEPVEVGIAGGWGAYRPGLKTQLAL